MKDEKQEEIYEQLEYYIINKEQENIKILLKKHGISYFKNFRRNGYGVLNWFMIYDLANMVKWIVEEGWDANDLDNDGENLLFYAYKSLRIMEHEHLVDFLIERGIHVDQLSKVGYTPILNAFEFGDFDLARKLYQNGANMNARNDEGEDVIHFIVKWIDDSKMIKEWIDLLLSKPERCDEELLKRLRTKRLELLMV